MDNSKLRKILTGTFNKSEKKINHLEVTIPYIYKNAVLYAPGTWNEILFTKEAIKSSYENMIWDKKNTSLFLDHSDDVHNWIGDVQNLKLQEDGKIMGDLHIVDKDVAQKIEYGAEFGISPTLQILDKDDKECMTMFENLNFSLVINPAMDTNYINEDKKEKYSKEENKMDNVDFNKIKKETEVELSKMSATPSTATEASKDDNSFKADTPISEGVSAEKDVELEKWDVKYINDLPDAAFAVIQPGGEKDESGKTVPRTNRYLPHHNASVTSGTDNSTVDLPHLRNALARVNQISYTEGIAHAKAHLEEHAKDLLKTHENSAEEEFARKKKEPQEPPKSQPLTSENSNNCIDADQVLSKSKLELIGLKLHKISEMKEAHDFKAEIESVVKDILDVADTAMEFNRKQEELNKTIKDMEMMAAKLSEKSDLIVEKDKMVATYQTKISDLNKKIAMYKERDTLMEQERKLAKFSKVLDNYCKFHGYSTGAQIEEAKTKLATLSDEALEIIGRDVSIGLSESEVTVPKNSAQLSQTVISPVIEKTEEVSHERKMTNLFEKFTQTE